ncbi:protein of unknown function [Pseudobutyrivibrio ruminis]|uniref:DUF3784 domain-containing protein n=2 Tax=Pseudobutyrivibrio ruminis TaxID=46206 RepID=A0A1H7L0W1_9FIRM|nr:protein of unknown function [Pseudobutyrivibrio ruminis]
MNIGAWMCGVLVIPFAIVGVLFGIFKEKATNFVAGFNTFSEKEQDLYDKVAISSDIRNQCLIWSALMLVGTALSLVISQYVAIPTFIIWLFLFFKDSHIDPYKAFEKYLLK